jgi:hypothetical protein
MGTDANNGQPRPTPAAGCTAVLQGLGFQARPEGVKCRQCVSLTWAVCLHPDPDVALLAPICAPAAAAGKQAGGGGSLMLPTGHGPALSCGVGLPGRRFPQTAGLAGAPSRGALANKQQPATAGGHHLFLIFQKAPVEPGPEAPWLQQRKRNPETSATRVWERGQRCKTNKTAAQRCWRHRSSSGRLRSHSSIYSAVQVAWHVQAFQAAAASTQHSLIADDEHRVVDRVGGAGGWGVNATCVALEAGLHIEGIHHRRSSHGLQGACRKRIKEDK